MIRGNLNVWAYHNSATGPPVLLPVHVGDAWVYDLVTDQPPDWHNDLVLCMTCGHAYVAMAQGEAMPKQLRCPRCANTDAVPRAHWNCSHQAHCECGHVWAVVGVGTCTEISSVWCPRCRSKVRRLAPWPMPS